jgi:acyl transferase domain-containing protein
MACVNSPKNVTLAGPADQIDIAKSELDKKGVFAQKLNTGVAYHSSAMQAIAKEYAVRIGDLKAESIQSSITMVSSVTGQVIEPEVLATPQYWVDNLTSPVQFAKALSGLAALASKSNSAIIGSPDKRLALTDLVEIGPHAALRRPVTDSMPHLRYHAWLQRSASPLHSTLHLAGSLFCRGFPISITTVNGQGQGKHPYLVDCPAYPFDHSRRYWDETRISREWRLREATPGFLLGRRVHDWNPLKPRWRNWLCVENIPWLGEHFVSATILSPIRYPSDLNFRKSFLSRISHVIQYT